MTNLVSFCLVFVRVGSRKDSLETDTSLLKWGSAESALIAIEECRKLSALPFESEIFLVIVADWKDIAESRRFRSGTDLGLISEHATRY